MSKRCCWRWVGQVIGRHVNGLDGSDRTHFGRGNTLLQTAHFFGQCRLVTHSRRHTTQQGGHFGTGQCVAVNVVHEEQHVFAFVAERFSDGQTGQGDAQTVAWWLVHLAVHHGHFGLRQVLEVHDAGVGHLVVEVIAFTGTLTHTGEHGQTAVRLGDVVDEFHHVHGLAHTGTTEQADLAAFGERANQVNHLDAGFQQFLRRAQFVVRRGFAVNGSGEFLAHWTTFVDGGTQHVHDAAQSGFTHWNGDGFSGVEHHQATTQAVGRTERNGAHDAVAELLLHFQCQGRAFHFQGIINLGHLIAWKFHVNHGANTLNNFSLGLHFSLQ